MEKSRTDIPGLYCTMYCIWYVPPKRRRLPVHPGPGGVAPGRVAYPGVPLQALHREGRHQAPGQHHGRVVMLLLLLAVVSRVVVGAELAPERDLPRAGGGHLGELEWRQEMLILSVKDATY